LGRPGPRGTLSAGARGGIDADRNLRSVGCVLLESALNQVRAEYEAGLVADFDSLRISSGRWPAGTYAEGHAMEGPARKPLSSGGLVCGKRLSRAAQLRCCGRCHRLRKWTRVAALAGHCLTGKVGRWRPSVDREARGRQHAAGRHRSRLSRLKNSCGNRLPSFSRRNMQMKQFQQSTIHGRRAPAHAQCPRAAVRRWEGLARRDCAGLPFDAGGVADEGGTLKLACSRRPPTFGI